MGKGHIPDVFSVNPWDEEFVGAWRGHTRSEVIGTADQCEAAFKSWRLSTHAERALRLEALAKILEGRRAVLAELMALEMGKPVGQGVAEADKCALVCRYYAEQGGAFLSDVPVTTDACKSFVAYEPLGVIYGIMPWNFPFWQVFRFAAPAVAAGNGVLLKHSPNVTGCALEIAGLFREAGFPEGLFGMVVVPGHRAGSVSRTLIGHPAVRAVTLTGSSRAGRAVASMAGKALKKCVLELGGSDPAVILADADLESAAKSVAYSRLINAGQNCIASKRMIVVKTVHRRFVELLEAEMLRVVAGNPLDPATTLGPMARDDLRSAVHDQVTGSIAMGAKLVTGGVLPGSRGFFYPPTVLDGVTPGMPAGDEETFGPVAAVMSAGDETEALELAEKTTFGLGASVYTSDTAKGEAFARKIHAGACFVNAYARSDPRLPFGGTGGSGYGRELGREGIMEFVNQKSVWIG
ncbi:MAG: NAD-dependent succinate-semialdehyde dehydrogenase [Candidatus Fermentibacteraceae bacterium]